MYARELTALEEHLRRKYYALYRAMRRLPVPEGSPETFFLARIQREFNILLSCAVIDFRNASGKWSPPYTSAEITQEVDNIVDLFHIIYRGEDEALLTYERELAQ